MVYIFSMINSMFIIMNIRYLKMVIDVMSFENRTSFIAVNRIFRLRLTFPTDKLLLSLSVGTSIMEACQKTLSLPEMTSQILQNIGNNNN
jgi:hypothetical protein